MQCLLYTSISCLLEKKFVAVIIIIIINIMLNSEYKDNVCD